MFPFPWPSQKNAGNSAIVEFRTIRLLSPDGKLTCESLQTFPRPMPRSLLLSARLNATRFELPASEIPFAEFPSATFPRIMLELEKETSPDPRFEDRLFPMTRV